MAGRDLPWNPQADPHRIRRRILAYLAKERKARDVGDIREYGGLRRCPVEAVWNELVALTRRGRVLFSYFDDRWEVAGFEHATRHPVFWHARWAQPGLSPAAPPEDPDPPAAGEGVGVG